MQINDAASEIETTSRSITRPNQSDRAATVVRKEHSLFIAEEPVNVNGKYAVIVSHGTMVCLAKPLELHNAPRDTMPKDHLASSV